MKNLYSVGTDENKYCVCDARDFGLGFTVEKVYPDGGHGFIESCDSLEAAKKLANVYAAKFTFNYSLLRKAITLAGGIPRVSTAAGMNPDALRRSLKNKREFTVQEMKALGSVLRISSAMVEKYFFCVT